MRCAGRGLRGEGGGVRRGEEKQIRVREVG